ncbi:MAG: hypothetical protein A3J76_04500 [Candidatus Moranbacteria bacterium RBG_13_45_13]|nr:MAG: hypothetical protein A3J76_04500 [Candidatus Moranbacteria bacterium RBG_13_45_13]
MSRSIKDLFKKLKDSEPSVELEGKILKAIAMERTQMVHRKMMIARGGFAVSFGALIYTLFVFGKTFLESDFWNLAKLIFSDTGIIAGHIGEFSISLLETLPAIEIFAMLVPVFTLLMMASWYFKYSNSNHYNHIT